MEMKNEVRTYMTRFLCEECLKEKGLAGEYKPTGKVLLSTPPKHEHKCTDCGRVLMLDKKYPIIEYEIISGWEQI